MSIIISPSIKLEAYTNIFNQEYYISTYYSLTGSNVSIEYKGLSPHAYTTTSSKISGYITDFGDNSALVTTDRTTPAKHEYSSQGTYYIKFSSVYENNNIFQYTVTLPVIIEPFWKKYDPTQLRLINELFLALPYTLKDIEIQPNEWGVEDIFNIGIKRLQANLDYLISNTQTIGNKSPSIYNGWLGNNSSSKAIGIRWFTNTYNSQYINNIETATTGGQSYFSDLRDSTESLNYIYALDGTNFRMFSSLAIPAEVNFVNAQAISEMLLDPRSFDINEKENFLFVSDTVANKIYRFSIDLITPAIDIQLVTGNFGSYKDHDKFNSPTEIKYVNGNVYVLDYNNFCIKKYNKDLNWLGTYTSTYLDEDQPISFAVDPNTSLVYVLSKTNNLYVFDSNTSYTVPFASAFLSETVDDNELLKIHFDDEGDFFYVLTTQNIFKYSTDITYINDLNIPKNSSINYTNIKSGYNKTILLTTPNAIVKCQDVLDIFTLGGGLPYKYWTIDQLKVSSNEFVSDLNYNRSLIRMAQNIKSFRDTLNAQFVIVSQQTYTKVVNYLSWIPLDLQNLPVLDPDVENETLGTGVNEFNVPQVLNREFKKLHNSLEKLNTFLDVKNASIDNKNKNLDCTGQFCWSWKATSCYDLTLPVIRTCDLNPVTHLELQSNFPTDLTYVPTDKTWGDAYSKCCRK
jgi:hypothetical protein